MGAVQRVGVTRRQVLEWAMGADKLHAYNGMTTHHTEPSNPAQAEIPLKSMDKANFNGPILFAGRKDLKFTVRLVKV